jgi:hypothetical protein
VRRAQVKSEHEARNESGTCRATSFIPYPNNKTSFLFEADHTRQAERLIESCEACNPDAEIPFSITSSTVLLAQIRA